MIRKILIEGVRTHERTEIELGRLTCLVGPNGSGKSTVLQSFQVLHAGEPESWGTKSEWSVLLEDVEGREAGVTFESELIHSAHGGGFLDRRKVKKGDEVIEPIYFRPETSNLRKPSEFKGRSPVLSSEGEYLAAVLASWKLSRQDWFDSVVEQLRKVVPNFKEIRPNTTLLDKDRPGFEIAFDFAKGANIPAAAVSEGTLLALALITKLHEIDSPRRLNSSQVILVDDIDRGLHPDAQMELIGLLRKLAELKNIQIVMTTHSPYIVDALDPDEVCVLALDDTGTTRARKLSEIPGAEKYRGMLSTGELWSSQGESWVLDEQAKSKFA